MLGLDAGLTVAERLVEFVVAVGEGTLEDVVLVELETPRTNSPFPTVERVVHIEVAGAVCAEGVVDWPCLKVEVPYIPIGSPSSPMHRSKTPAS